MSAWGVIFLFLNVAFAILNWVVYAETGRPASLIVAAINTAASVVLIVTLSRHS